MRAFEPFLAWAVALLICGCEDEPIRVATGAVVTANGLHLNGPYLNGLHLNGLHLNGLQMNGTMLEDIRLDHVHLDGLPLNEVHLLGATLEGRRADGRAASGAELGGALVHASLSDGAPITLRIDTVVLGAPAPRYVVSIAAAGQPFEPLCGDDHGVPVPALALAGTWDESTGAHTDDPARFTFACVGYALAKCVELGYAPWGATTECRAPSDCHELALAPFHQACTRMLRADYCGDGTATTRDGTLVDVWDALGIEVDSEPGWSFEAEWTAAGAACVARTRWPTLEGDQEDVAAYLDLHCPGRRGAAGCGGSGSAFFAEHGFTAPLDARPLLRTRVAGSAD